MGDTTSFDVDVTGTVRAPIDEVWALFRPFGEEITRWWPIYEWVKLDAPGKDEIGAVRSFKSKTGRTYKERLSLRDDEKHQEHYELVSVEPSVPTLETITTVVTMTPSGQDTIVRWSSQVKAGSIFKSRILDVQREVYEAAIKSLDSHFHPSLGELEVRIVQAKGLAKSHHLPPDAYVVLDVDATGPTRSSVRLMSTAPHWNERRTLDVRTLEGKLELSVWDARLGTDRLLGRASYDLHALEAGTPKPLTLSLLEAGGDASIDVVLTLRLHEGGGLGYTEDAQRVQAAVHIADLLDKIQQQAAALAVEVAKGPQAKYGYARYARAPELPDVPLERLPRMVDGLPAQELLPPAKVGRMVQRGTEYLYSQAQFVDRLEASKDPFEAYFADWVKRPYAADHALDDQEVARQMIQGLNPMVLSLVTSIDALPPAMRELSAGGERVAELIPQKRLFLCDYAELAALAPYRDMFFYAPYALVQKKVDPGGGASGLELLAIQLTREASGNVVFTKEGTPPNRWKLAKMHLACADNQYHQWIYHLGFAHLAMEPFAVAYHNAFATKNGGASEHPIGKLLAPHFKDTIGINFLARRTLVSDVAPFTDRTFSTGTAQALQMFLAVWEKYDFFAQSFPEQLRARGFDEERSDGLDDYYFREDGYRIWNALDEYVGGVIDAVYADDAAVAADATLASWAEESTDAERADIPGFPTRFDTKSLLRRTLTTLIFNVSAQHSAVNFPQIDYLSYVPNRPDSLFRAMPEGEDEIDASIVKEALPSELIAHFQISFAYLLTLPASYPLAEVDAMKETFPKVHERFVTRLAEVAEAIRARNSALLEAGKAPYPYLDPSRIEASIAI